MFSNPRLEITKKGMCNTFLPDSTAMETLTHGCRDSRLHDFVGADSMAMGTQTPQLWGLKRHHGYWESDSTAVRLRLHGYGNSDSTSMGTQTPQLLGLKTPQLWGDFTAMGTTAIPGPFNK